MTTENTAIEIVVPEREQLPPSLLSNIETGFIDQKAEMKLARTIRVCVVLEACRELQDAKTLTNNRK